MSNFDWNGLRVVVTGGAGFIGSNLAGRLLEEGATVILVDNLERGSMKYLKPVMNQVDFRGMDVRDSRTTMDVMENADVVFHLASKVGGIKVYLEHPGMILSNNLLIDQNVFASVVAQRVPYVCYASSAHVYPEDRQMTPDAAPLTEDEAYPANPGLSYGWAKLIGEQSLVGYTREQEWLNCSLARIVGAYGANQDIGLETGSVIPVLCHRMIKAKDGDAIPLWGTGEETRSYCYIDDIVEGLMRSIEAQKETQVVGPFNLGCEGRHTIREIAETLVKVSGKDLTLQFDPDVKTTIWGQAVSAAKAKECLNGWEPQFSLEQGLERTYAHVADRLGD